MNRKNNWHVLTTLLPTLCFNLLINNRRSLSAIIFELCRKANHRNARLDKFTMNENVNKFVYHGKSSRIV